MSSLIDEVSASAYHYRAVQYATVASTALLIYDSVIAFSDEVEFIWRSKWNVGKLLFFATRYLAIVDSSLMLVYLLHPGLDSIACEYLFNASIYLILTGVVIAEVILSIRTYALWGRSRCMLITLILLLFSCFIFIIVFYSITIDTLGWWPTIVPTIVPCVTQTKVTRGHVFIIFTMLMAFDCAIVLLTVWKGVTQWRHQIHRSPLLDIFYRDGLWYFVCLFAFSSANFTLNLFSVADGDFAYLLLEMQHVFHSIISARMILNMRGAAAALGIEKSEHLETPSRLTSIRFASRVVDASGPGSHSVPDSDNSIEMIGLYSSDSQHRTEGVMSSGL